MAKDFDRVGSTKGVGFEKESRDAEGEMDMKGAHRIGSASSSFPGLNNSGSDQETVKRMKGLGFLFTVALTLLGFCHVFVAAVERNDEERRTYIVHMATSQMPESFQERAHWYDSSLKSVSESAEMLYKYSNVIHGFSTRLTAEEARSLQGRPGILSILEEVRYELHTTRTPEFLGLDKSADLFPESGSASEVIIGVLDTGIWPESKSFDDTGLDPSPVAGKASYEATLGPIDERKESKSPRDDDGHGTHTATTAAGSVVEGASLFGFAEGTARGMATRARIAAYKVCWIGGCFSTDILAALDKAVEDNVNILSLSLGGGMSDYYRDSVAMGAFGAMEKGILVSCSAGNSGPSPYSLSNVAPWITTVGAGTLDRDFPAFVSLGNGKNYSGVSLYRGDPLPGTLLPFVYAGNASNAPNGNLCMTNTLIPEKVAGKMVMCDRGVNPRVQKGSVVKAAGGIGMVLANTGTNGEELVADAHLLPATAVGQKYKGWYPTLTGGAAFSSRGPNSITPDILKPDLIAPGVNILAGWSGAVGPTGLPTDKRHVDFNIISGTSMSCPHISGLAGLLKAAHPEWSPAAIRSALMTTAYTNYKSGQKIQDVATGKPSTAFDHGAGHVDPVSALNPGLIYDLTVDDYLNFLCAINYSAPQISILAKRNFTCDTDKKYSVADLNYPSFAVPLQTPLGGGGEGSSTVVKHTRTLTNVGSPSTYKVSIFSESESIKISVEPGSLSFSELNEKKSFTVTFTATSMPSNTNIFGRIEWSDGKHVVGSPIVVSWT
ncbi:Subtilisin-like protease SBT1.7 [Vitis vinifera]|uniref:Subtilisin-like protease SBT1.7 n=1 Tax=Vitis vinifera TaxID=29760 RepID=A0A438KPQ6_VITVI|nr:Subtilisin-like protease SBT1.7 [Vitis vinifera]